MYIRGCNLLCLGELSGRRDLVLNDVCEQINSAEKWREFNMKGADRGGLYSPDYSIICLN